MARVERLLRLPCSFRSLRLYAFLQVEGEVRMRKNALILMVKWLQIWSEDCVALSSFLNQFGPMKGCFKEAPLAPRTSVISVEAALARAASLLDNMASNNAHV